MKQYGLSSEEAKKLLEKNGYNELEAAGRKSILKVFLEQFKDFLVIILLAAAVISAVLGDAESAVVIFAVVAMNAVLGTVQNVKAQHSIESLKALSAPSAKVIRDGVKQEIPSREVVNGDLILLEAGDYICADGVIVGCASLRVNESILTGESEAVEKETEQYVHSGCFAVYGRADVLVTGTGMHTEIGKIANLLKNTSEQKTPLQETMDNFGRRLSIGILMICALVFALSLFRHAPVMDAFMFAVALAVAAIPEALSSIVTIVLAFGTQKLAKENAIIRKLQAVEGLGSVSIICSDKTGTLTQNKMTIKKCYVNMKTVEADAFSGQDKNQFRLMAYGLLCNDASVHEGSDIGDPTESAMLHFAKLHGCPYETIRAQYPRLSEVPFDSDRKLMSTLHKIDGRYVMITKGAPDVLLERLEKADSDGAIKPMVKALSDMILKANEGFSAKGLRVLAYAYKIIEENRMITVRDEYSMTFLGLTAMMDPPREESKAAVAKCIKAGIRPVMITGDHRITAEAIAREIGILHDGGLAVEGSYIDDLSDEALKIEVDKISVYARVTPEHKIRIVRAWQSRGQIVAMTGDGVNDAPALKQADVGVAMGITGSEAAKDAAAMVLADDNFATIVSAVENGRNVYANIKKSIKFLLSGNAAGIFAVMAASLSGLSLPFAPVHLLFINLLTDSLPAIALGLEPHTSKVMEEKPRPKSEGILTKKLLRQIGIEGLIIAAATMAGYFAGLKTSAAAASTMAFATLCMSRLLHGFNCKREAPVLFSRAMWNNRYMIGAVLAGLVLLNCVLLIPGLHSIFSIAPLSGMQLGVIYGSAIGSMLMIQLIKLIAAARLASKLSF